jgi:hypothetical protein
MAVICTRHLLFGDDCFAPRRPGEPIELISETHEAVIAHPECFTAAPPTAERGHTGAAPEPADEAVGLEPWRLVSSSKRCLISTRPVDMPNAFRTDAFEDAMAGIAPTEHDGHESFVLLYGSLDRHGFDVCAAIAPRQKRSRYRVELDMDDVERITEKMANHGRTLVGELHAQPELLTPSRTDLDAYARFRAHIDLRHYLALIAVWTRESWVIQPWLVTRGFGSRDHCAPLAHLRCVALL